MHFSIRLPDPIYKRLKQEASRRGLTKKDLIIIALEQYLGGEEGLPEFLPSGWPTDVECPIDHKLPSEKHDPMAHSQLTKGHLDAAVYAHEKAKQGVKKA